MRSARALSIAFLLLAGLGATEEGLTVQMPEFVGNLTCEVHQDAPIGLSGGGRLTVRLANTSGGVVGLGRITPPTANYPASVRLVAKGADAPDAVWGPEIGAQLATVRGGMTASQHLAAWRAYPGQDAYRRRLELRESRAPLVLLPREGYAWIIDVAATWLSDDAAGQARGQRQLALHAGGGVFTLQIPDLAADAISPGKPVRWGERRDTVTVPKVRPFSVVAGPLEQPAPLAGSADAHGAAFIIQIDGEVQAGCDLPLTYLIGNLSAQPLWVQQNKLTQAWPRWRIQDRHGKEVAVADGALAMPMQRILPERAPFPLLPGEFLCWKHLIPASALQALKTGQAYVLLGSLETPVRSGWPVQGEDVTDILAAKIEFSVQAGRR